MSSKEIGPQIPEHLLPTFQENEGEIASSLDIGPQLDTGSVNETSETKLGRETPRSDENTGPTTPKVSSNFGEQDGSTEDIDAYLPALPPDIIAERQRKKAEREKATTTGVKETTSKRIIGPAMIPPKEYQNSGEEEPEEEIIGPVLPKDLGENDEKYVLERTIQEFEERSERMRSSIEVG